FLFTRQIVKQIAQHCPFEHDWCGVTQLMWDARSTDKLTRMLQGHFPDALVQFLTQEQTQEKIGLPIDMPSLYYSLGGWLSPAEFPTAFVTLLQEEGALTAYVEQPIDKLTWLENQQCWQLDSDGQSFQHRCVVIANGHQFD